MKWSITKDAPGSHPWLVVAPYGSEFCFTTGDAAISFVAQRITASHYKGIQQRWESELRKILDLPFDYNLIMGGTPPASMHALVMPQAPEGLDFDQLRSDIDELARSNDA